MTPETRAFLAKLKPIKFVWCQFANVPGSKHDEHQVCLDREAAHYAQGGETWGCVCRCHN